MKTLYKVSQQTAWQILGKAVTSLSTILILGLITRTYGEDGTGIFTLSLALLAFFTLATDLGFNSHLMPNFLKEDVTLAFRKLLGLRLILSLLLVFLAGGVILLWPAEQLLFKQITLLGLVSIVQAAVFMSTNAIFQGKLRFDLSVISLSLGTLVILGSVFYVARLELGLNVLMFGYIAGWITTGIFTLYFAKGFVKSLLPLWDFQYTKDLIRQVWPISLTLVLNVVYFRLDAFIISFTRNFVDVGVYNLSFQIFQSLLVIPAFIMNSFYPVMIRNFNENKKRFREHLLKASLIMFTVASMGTILTLLLSPLVIDLISGGKGFGGSATSLRILSLGFPAFFVSSVLMWTLVTLRKYKTMLIIYLIGLAFNATLNLILIPQYSYLAAAGVTVLSEYLILILQIIILKPLLSKI